MFDSKKFLILKEEALIAQKELSECIKSLEGENNGRRNKTVPAKIIRKNGKH